MKLKATGFKRKGKLMYKAEERLFIASREDLEDMIEQNRQREEKDKYALCLAAKTYHKMVAKLDNSSEVGYTGNMAKDQKEYLIAERPTSHILAVNLIDAPDSKYIPSVIIEKCLSFIQENYDKGRTVVIACDKGESRSACILFMFLMRNKFFNELMPFSQAEAMFQNVYYPYYNPNKGMRVYTEKFHDDLKRSVQNGKK